MGAQLSSIDLAVSRLKKRNLLTQLGCVDLLTKCFLSGSVVKNLRANGGGAGSISGSGRSLGEGNGNPLQREFYGQKSLVGYSPWCHKESDVA